MQRTDPLDLEGTLTLPGRLGILVEGKPQLAPSDFTSQKVSEDSEIHQIQTVPPFGSWGSPPSQPRRRAEDGSLGCARDCWHHLAPHGFIHFTYHPNWDDDDDDDDEGDDDADDDDDDGDDDDYYYY